MVQVINEGFYWLSEKIKLLKTNILRRKQKQIRFLNFPFFTVFPDSFQYSHKLIHF